MDFSTPRPRPQEIGLISVEAAVVGLNFFQQRVDGLGFHRRCSSDRIKALLVLTWRQKPTARSQLKLTIEDVLDTGLPRAYDKPLYEQKCSALFEHIYENYPAGDDGTYALTG